ncbi:hypothetical protein KC356_g9308 [Hortaea werneckii]|nr:hypothetical protein KC356_g9308 [Hortaea werneckii]
MITREDTMALNGRGAYDTTGMYLCPQAQTFYRQRRYQATMIIDPATTHLLRILYTIPDDCDMSWTHIPSAQDAAPAVCQVYVTGRAFPSLYHS